MEIKLHANATTTPRVRRYLQQSDKSDRELAKELGISVTTVRRWRHREQTGDRHTTPNVIHKAMRQEQVALVNVLRDTLQAPLDELLFMVNDGLGIPVSRATLNRYLRPAHQREKGTLQGKRALKAGVLPDTLTLHYRRLSMTMDDGGDHHLLWAREPVSGWCHARVYSGISLPLVKNWLNDTLACCPADIQCLETELVKWLGIEMPGMTVFCQSKTCANTIFFTDALQTLVPAATEPDELVQRLCELWNTGKTQKKLGECTPQAFLEALRR
ncbi:MAG TPA: helix-turn-helix domain-containing protein [Scandinavium sp.]|jgi:transcriptional regulator with XRE-family HTH domain|uniref:helix-turn-helix domain-containing protein n=1 Tax=Scandinavium sp. TaxID=2830653 RepID=UPI002E377E91|nr:helix-turn-helix domain-containing protein [Scandinavium sp.]HEX4503712.1 helix-turn-helix domain-containing protein [Scandinavium sp.]